MITGETRLWKLTRKQVREHMRDGHFKGAILPTGSNEGHGPHLPLKVDAATSTYVSVEAARRLYPRVLVAPCLAVGHSPQHLEFAGSMTLRVETQIRVLTDYCRSLRNYGIRRFAIVNGHGNNMAVNAQAARRITEEIPGVRVASFAYWEAIDRNKIAEINDGHVALHATCLSRCHFRSDVARPR